MQHTAREDTTKTYVASELLFGSTLPARTHPFGRQQTHIQGLHPTLERAGRDLDTRPDISNVRACRSRPSTLPDLDTTVGAVYTTFHIIFYGWSIGAHYKFN